MNSFIKSSQQISMLLCQRYSLLGHSVYLEPAMQRSLLSIKGFDKPLISSTSQCVVRFISVDNRKETSQYEKNISLALSVFKKTVTSGLSVLKSVQYKELKNAPYPTVVYGFGGLIPFFSPPIYFIIVSYSPILFTSQLVYGATILAFVGGVKWGNAVAKNDISHVQIGVSTIPSLVAWSSMLVPEPIGSLILSSGLIGALFMDLLSSNYPPWFMAMRSTLTFIAVSSLMTSMLCYLCK